MLLELIVGLVLGAVQWILSLIPTVDVSTALNFAPAIAVMMALNEHLPVQEVLGAVAIILVVDLVIWAFDTFDWLWTKIPILGH